MSRLIWDDAGTRNFETGVSQGVVYLKTDMELEPDKLYEYEGGEAWNGLISVTESPSGAEANNLYADDMKYGIIRSAESLDFTIEAYTYPSLFNSCIGFSPIVPGLLLAQQKRRPFGFCYKSKIGDDEHPGIDTGYKLHLIYNAVVTSFEQQYQTINDSPDALVYSFECKTTPENPKDPKWGNPSKQYGMDWCSHLVIDSRYANQSYLSELEEYLYESDDDPQNTHPIYMPEISFALSIFHIY